MHLKDLKKNTPAELVAMAEEVSPTPDPREMDMLLATGEQVTIPEKLVPHFKPGKALREAKRE